MDKNNGEKNIRENRKNTVGQSLAKLEAQIMDVIWDIEPPVSTNQVFKIMYPLRELDFSTISNTMSKLAKKGLLIQERPGKNKTEAFFYTPTLTKEEITLSLLNAVSRQIFNKPLDEAIINICGIDNKIDNKSIDILKAKIELSENENV